MTSPQQQHPSRVVVETMGTLGLMIQPKQRKVAIMTSKLYGQIETDTGSKVTRQASRIIEATLQTRHGAVVVTLNHKGEGTITTHSGPVLNASKFSVPTGPIDEQLTFTINNEDTPSEPFTMNLRRNGGEQA